MATSPPLPDPIESELTRLLDGPDAEFWPGVARLCQEHPALTKQIMREAERMLADGQGTCGDGPTQAPAHPKDHDADLRAGDRIGPFAILDVIGHGGMGSVYLAEQKEPVRRRVALKVIKLGMDTKAVLARFEAERQALAMMDHSHIAKVLEAGVTPKGKPYFAMEYVKGVPITRYCDDNKLSLEDRLLLFQQVCSGVQHAHTKGVIHRDLTPNNVLVTVQDSKPVAKIIDFGLARATDHKLTEMTLFTEQGVILGTPEYMSPEQAGLNALDIDMRSDVYTLGVLLYELLTGKLPFEAKELRAQGYDGMCKTIREAEPPRPSTKVTTHQAGTEGAAKLRRTDARTLLKRLRGDLDWIALKCLEKDRTRRYETVSQLADDVERYLDSEPVLARAPSAAYRLAKFARRHRVQLVAAAGVFVALVGGLGAAIYYWRDAARQAAEAKRQEEVAIARGFDVANLYETLLARKREFDQLAGIVRLGHLQSAREELAVPWTETSAAQRWLASADELLALRPEIENTLTELRSRASFFSAVTDGDLVRREQRPGPGSEIHWLEEQFGPAPPGETEGYRFTDEAQGFLYVALTDLTAKLARFEKEERAALSRRLRCAELSPAHPRARVTWHHAAEAIASADGVAASALYAQQPIKLRPQLGLVPIGMNPVTKLWEFYELSSAWDPAKLSDAAALEIPVHDAEGGIAVGDDTGIVLVLLPGGSFTMGAQNKTDREVNYDPQAAANEAPPHRVTLAPFFLARHELTQGQWRRLGGKLDQRPFANGDALPVADVDWSTSDQLLRSHGLTLPTEAQWEYGCRAGTATPWWTGVNEQSVAGELDKLLPVGRRRSNAFGLFDVHGNIWEWCADHYDEYSRPWRPGDGLRLVDQDRASTRVHRGGNFGASIGYGPRDARSSNRGPYAPTHRDGLLGARPARALGSD